MTTLTDATLRRLAERSVEIIGGIQDVGGAYPASPTFPVYRYSWLRDGAFIADAMSRAGRIDSTERFFGWCTKVLLDRRSHIEELVRRRRLRLVVERHEHPPTRYTLDGAEAHGTEWWDFQLDGYGTWIWAIRSHLARHPHRRARVGEWSAAIELCVDYLSSFWDAPCYDWWEEHADGVHGSTLGAIAAGLRAASEYVDPNRSAVALTTAATIEATLRTDGTVDGHLVKTLHAGARVDASLIAVFTPFEVIAPDDPVAEATYRRIVEDLAPDGVHRYLGDTYFGGGRWVVLAGFVGAHEARTGRADRALERLEWMAAQATDGDLLPEQTAEHPLDPTMVEHWVHKWGPIATPLLWSHAMYITLADELGLLDDGGRS